MAKYRKKPVVIEARQWFLYGDHIEVGFYIYPEENDHNKPCAHCSTSMHELGPE